MLALKNAELSPDIKRLTRRVAHGESILIFQPEIENVVIITEKEYNELSKKKARDNFKNTVSSMQKKSIAGGLSKMTQEEINAEITAVRTERSCI